MDSKCNNMHGERIKIRHHNSSLPVCYAVSTGSAQSLGGITFLRNVGNFTSRYGLTSEKTCAISGFRREVDENCAHLGYYAASGGHILPTFRDKLSVPSSVVKDSRVIT